MAKIQIHLEPNENLEDTKELLIKALKAGSNGASHTEEMWSDPALQLIEEKLTRIQRKLYDEMINEIEEVLLS